MRVYLIHFEQPISPTRTTQHYVGCTFNLPKRIKKHRQGQGARLMQVAKERGISWQVVRVWPAGWPFERWLKAQKQHSSFCPICTPSPRQTMPKSIKIPKELRHDSL